MARLATKKCTVCKAPVPPGRRNKCSDACRKRAADSTRRGRDRAAGGFPEPGQRRRSSGTGRFQVLVRGGVFKLGSDSFGLDVRGFVCVNAKNPVHAKEVALAVLAQMSDRCELLPDDGLDLDIVKAIPVRKGDVEELESEAKLDGLEEKVAPAPEITITQTSSPATVLS